MNRDQLFELRQQLHDFAVTHQTDAVNEAADAVDGFEVHFAVLPDFRRRQYLPLQRQRQPQLPGAVSVGVEYLPSQRAGRRRVGAAEGGSSTAYIANNLNQYTAINDEAPTHDAGGNMLTNGAWTYTWNAENRLIAAENATLKVKFDYDYLGRRFRKKVYAKDGATRTLQTTKTFVYDGFKQIAAPPGASLLRRPGAQRQEQLNAIAYGRQQKENK